MVNRAQITPLSPLKALLEEQSQLIGAVLEQCRVMAARQSNLDARLELLELQISQARIPAPQERRTA